MPTYSIPCPNCGCLPDPCTFYCDGDCDPPDIGVPVQFPRSLLVRFSSVSTNTALCGGATDCSSYTNWVELFPEVPQRVNGGCASVTYSCTGIVSTPLIHCMEALCPNDNTFDQETRFWVSLSLWSNLLPDIYCYYLLDANIFHRHPNRLSAGQDEAIERHRLPDLSSYCDGSTVFDLGAQITADAPSDPVSDALGGGDSTCNVESFNLEYLGG